MRILVTGATGVLGRRAVPLLVAAGHDVTAAARTEAKATALRAVGATPVPLDLFDPDALRRVVPGHDAVVNLATSIPPSSKMARRGAWATNDRIRREASRLLVDAALAAGVGRVVQESITFLYADGADRWLDEDAPTEPAGVTASAAEAEAAVARVTAAGGAGVVLRFAQLVAPDSGHDRDLMRTVQRGILPLFGDPDGYESYVHADDAAAAVVAALDAPGGVYNVVDDEPMTRRVHAELLSEVAGRPVRLLPAVVGALPVLRVRARSQRVSNRRLHEATGWRPASASMRQGWAELAAALSASEEVPRERAGTG